MGLLLRDLTTLVDNARKRGARGSEVLLYEEFRSSLEVRRGTASKKVENAVSVHLSVRCWLEGGCAGHATGSVDERDAVLDRALEVAARAAPDPTQGPVGRLGSNSRGLGIDDRRYPQISMADRADVLTSAERGARSADRRAQTSGFTYEDKRIRRCFANSKGSVLEEWSTLYRTTGSVSISDGRTTLALHDVIASRTFSSIASLPFGATLTRRGAALLGTGPTLSGPVRVVFPPHITAVVLAWLAPFFTEEGLQTTFLSQAKPGKPFIDPRLHLVEDGQLPGGLLTQAFDDRGVSPIPLTLIREGLVDASFLSVEQARTKEQRPTGHFFGETLRPSNLQLRGGTRSMNALTSDMPMPVFVIDLIEDPVAGLDQTTGDVRWVCSGFVRESGKVTGAVRKLHLHGNLIEVFNRLVDITSDTDRVGSVDAPGLILDGFEIS